VLIHIDVKKLGRIHDGAGHHPAAQRGRYSARREDAAAERRPASCAARSRITRPTPITVEQQDHR
jgi:hypothetical protein